MECKQLCVTGIAFPTSAALPSPVRDAGPSRADFSTRASGTAAGDPFREVLLQTQTAEGPVTPGQAPASNNVGSAKMPGAPGTVARPALPLSLDPSEAKADTTDAPSTAASRATVTVVIPVQQGKSLVAAASGVPVWDPTLGTGEALAKPASVAKLAAKEVPELSLPVPGASQEKAAPPTGTVLPDPGKAKSAQPDEAGESRLSDKDLGTRPLAIVAPVDAVPLPAVPLTFALPLALSEAPAASGKPGPNIVPGPMVAPGSPQELQAVPEVAVRLIIRAQGEPVVPAAVEATPPPAVAPEPPRSRDSRQEMPDNAPAAEPGQNHEVDSPVRLESPVRPLPARVATESEPDRRVAAKKPLPSGAEAPLEAPAIRRGPETALVPAVSSSTAGEASAPQLREPTAAAVVKEQVPAEPLPKPPLKTMSLEFSPDGSGDVHLKLSERAGEVHVSLHSSDPVLNHQLRNGISDLASTLARAGYEADAWTSQDGGGRHQREQAPQPRQQQTPADQKFDIEMNQSPQEVL